jgi:HSP20 family protein
MKNLLSLSRPTLLPIERRYNPFLKLQQEVDRSINDFYNMFATSIPSFKGIENAMINPSINIVEDDEHFKVEAEMPGMNEEDVKVFINDHILCIQGEKNISKKNEGKNFIMQEIGYGTYERTIPLPEYVNADEAKASFKKGMLWVNFSKKEGSQKQGREVKVEKANDK